MTGREAAIVEEPAGTGLREADQRHLAEGPVDLGKRRARAGDDAEEALDRLAGRLEDLGDAFRRRPARAPVAADPLRAVEGRRIEARPLGESGHTERMTLGENVDGRPDPFV